MELLRYLTQHSDPDIKPKLPIYLFTMGNPLRQLYGLRFPHLYAWARQGDSAWPNNGPAPSLIGTKQWVNAYRSGDYVGRYLWHADISDDRSTVWSVDAVHVDAEGGKRELCIGSGAHIHYWDETAPEIAVELDRLVWTAATSK